MRKFSSAVMLPAMLLLAVAAGAYQAPRNPDGDPEDAGQIPVEPAVEPEPADDPEARVDPSRRVEWARGNVVPPKLLKRGKPAYPRNAKGTVIVQAVIDTGGRLKDIEVLNVLAPDFVDAAVNAMKRWKFRPATRNSEPVPMRYGVKFDFGIREPTSN